MRGFCGQALLIDLSDKSFKTLPIEEHLYCTYLGGRGLCGYFLDKFTDKDPIVFFTGAFTGTDVTGSGLCAVMHRNPMTGGLFRSEFGGEFAFSLKMQNYDGLIIIGTAEDTVYVTIDGEITFKEPLTADYSAIIPGKSAQNGFLHCKIIADDLYTTHRGGTGYLMYSKNLLGISVKKTSEPLINADREDIDRLINASPSLTGRLGIGRFGTAALYDLAYARNMLPNSFFGTEADENSNASALLSSCKSTDFACYPCAVACKKRTESTPLPDFDDFAMLLAAGIKSEDITEIYAECFRQGYDIITICHCINILGEDPYRLIRAADDRLKNGAYALDKNALCVKKLEIPSFDPRGAYGTALGYAASTNGADWTSALAVTHEILRKPFATDRLSFDLKARLNASSENAKAAADSLIVCGYTLFAVSLEEYAKTASQITGIDITAASLSEAGERIWAKETDLIRKLGFTADDDCLPDFFFDTIGRELFDCELRKYHGIRGLK